MSRKNFSFNRFTLIGFVCFGLFLSGCSSAGKNGYDTVAGYLESGGSYYRISQNTETLQIFKNSLSCFENSLFDGEDLSFNENKMLASALYELIFRHSGIAVCQWSGASSVRLPDKLDVLYRNRRFYLLPENPSGLLWQMPGKKNYPVLKELSELPADTIFAGDFFLNLNVLGEILSDCKINAPEFENFCRGFLNSDFKSVADNISGEWGIVVFPSAGKDYMDFVITCPDKNKILFNAIARFVKVFPHGRVEGNEAFLRNEDFKDDVSCLFGDKRLTIFSSSKAKEKFLSSKSVLSSQPEFKRLSAGIPQEGVAVFYYAGIKPETRTVVLPPELGGGKIDPADIDRPGLAVVRREKNGIAIVSHSGFDVPASEIARFVLKPFTELLAYPELLNFADKKTEKKVPSPDAGSEQAALAKNGQCRKNIQKIAAALKLYAEKNKSIPAEMDIAGIRRLLDSRLINFRDLICPATKDKDVASADLLDFNSCSYIYLGAWGKKRHAKLPVVIDRPGNHPDSLHVLFNDGSVEFFKLENCVNIKRVAGFLHTKYNYSEEDFGELIKRASLLDDCFEKR